MKKLHFLFLFLIIGISLKPLNAQNYQTAIGIRLGVMAGITAKHFIDSKAALEGMLTTRWGGFSICGLYELHQPLSPSNLDWYYGAGAHFGAFNGSEDIPWAENGKSYAIFGVDGIIGIEYTFDNAPINLSLDWKPSINLTGYSGFWGAEFGLSCRYAF